MARTILGEPMRSRSRPLAGLLTVVASGSLLAVPAAAADTPSAAMGPASITQCGDSWRGYTCFWARENYSPDTHVKHIPRVASGDCRTVEVDPMYLGSRSFFNRTTGTQRMWSNANCTGQNYLVGANEKIWKAPFTVNSVGGL